METMRRTFKLKALAYLLVSTLVLPLLPLFSLKALAADHTYNIDYGNITITKNAGDSSKLDIAYCASPGVPSYSTIAATDNIIIFEINDYTGCNISVISGEANITLEHVKIYTPISTPFSISSGAIVHLTLSGANSLDTGDSTVNAGMQVPSGATVVIGKKTSDTGDSLHSRSMYGAGIGGSSEQSGGTVTINGGTITAVSDLGGAGIGGGSNGSGGLVTINGGIVTVSSAGGAGIGGGINGAGGITNINSGTVTANGGSGGAGIGGGAPISDYGGSGGTTTITGGTVIAKGGLSGDPKYMHQYAANIGGGINALNHGTLVIDIPEPDAVIDASYGGSITGSGPYTIAASSGYVIDSLKLDGVEVSDATGQDSYEIISVSKSLVVTFAYTANFLEPANGSLTVTSAGETITSGQIIRGGQMLAITAAPDAGYVLENLTVNGEDITDEYASGYTYTVGTKGHYRALTAQKDTGTQGAQIAASFVLESSLDDILVSIEVPDAITGVLSGTAKTAAALGLPAEVTLVTDHGTALANVIWDAASCSYDPGNIAAQTFTVLGAVALPDGVINPNNVVLSTCVSVSVCAAQPVPAALLTAAADGAADVLTSTRIDLTFDTAITGLKAEDITLTDETGSAVKGALSGSGTSWSVALDEVTAQGDVSVAVASPAGYSISGSPKTITVYKAAQPVPAVLLTAAADGTADTVTSTKIDLTFDTAITGLKAEDILLTDGTGAAVKGTLTGSGTSWSVALDSVTAQGEISAAVASPSGYSISGSPKTVAVYKTAQPVPITLLTAAADGTANTVTSTKIDLTFDTAVVGLKAEDITLTNGTGSVIKGSLTGSGTSWSVALDEVTIQGDVSVAVASPSGFSITGSPKTVAVYKASIPSGTPPLITTSTLENGRTGLTYSQALLATGDTPVTWTVETGSLPGGLTLSGGIISGTPLEAGAFPFAVKAQNSAGFDTKALSITVDPSSYTIAASADLGGSITPGGMVAVAAGSSQTFSIQPDTGFAVASVAVDGIGQGPINEYTFAAVDRDHTIHASFTSLGDNMAFGVREREVSSTLISAQGLFRPSAKLNAIPLDSASREELEARLSGKDVIAAFEITIDPEDAFRPPLNVSFEIGEMYNGRTVYILHRLQSGEVEQFTPVVSSGRVSITVSRLSPFLLAADPWIAITAQPQDATVINGQTAAFSVSAQGAAQLSYQWQKKTGLNAAWTDIPGAAGPTYTTSQTTLLNSGFQYRVVITDALNNSVVSDAAALTVVKPPDTGDHDRPVLYTVLTVFLLAFSILLFPKRKDAQRRGGK